MKNKITKIIINIGILLIIIILAFFSRTSLQKKYENEIANKEETINIYKENLSVCEASNKTNINTINELDKEIEMLYQEKESLIKEMEELKKN